MRKLTCLFLIIISCLLASCSNEGPNAQADEWSITPTFNYESFLIRGTEKISMIDKPFVADKQQLYIWHLWGDEKQLGGNKGFKMVAFHKDSTDKLIIEENVALALNISGDKVQTAKADRYVSTSIALPKPGLWRLDTFIKTSCGTVSL